MSLSPSHDQVAPDVVQPESRPVLVEWAVAIAYGGATSAVMIGWLYLLASAVWNGASWLMS